MARRLRTGFGEVVVISDEKDGTGPARTSPIRRRSSLTLRQRRVALRLGGREVPDPPSLLGAPALLATREIHEGDHPPQVVELAVAQILQQRVEDERDDVAVCWWRRKLNSSRARA